MTSANHPDFEATHPDHRWAGALADLGRLLRERAWKGRGENAWYVLPRGALVAMRVRPEDFLKELRIARRSALDPKWQKAWDHECQVFLEHLGCLEWQAAPSKPGTCEKIYVEARAAQSLAPEVGEVCVRCGAPAAKGMYKEALCTRCAMQAGSEETAVLRRAREQKEKP